MPAATATSGSSNNELTRTSSRTPITPRFSQEPFPSPRSTSIPRTPNPSIIFLTGPRRFPPPLFRSAGILPATFSLVGRLFRRHRRWRNQRHVVLAHRLIERKNVLRKNVAPLRQLRFQPLIELRKQRLF